LSSSSSSSLIAVIAPATANANAAIAFSASAIAAAAAAAAIAVAIAVADATTIAATTAVVDCYVFITPTPKELLLTPSRRLHVEILVLRLFSRQNAGDVCRSRNN
jgi:hypothetical protein